MHLKSSFLSNAKLEIKNWKKPYSPHTCIHKRRAEWASGNYRMYGAWVQWERDTGTYGQVEEINVCSDQTLFLSLHPKKRASSCKFLILSPAVHSFFSFSSVGRLSFRFHAKIDFPPFIFFSLFIFFFYLCFGLFFGIKAMIKRHPERPPRLSK